MPTDTPTATAGRQLRFAQAVNEAIDVCMAADPRVYVLGLGVPDPKGIFGTTLGLAEKYGPDRVMDMPTSEGGMTGVAIGSALTGMRPIMTHQRVDFALLAVEQLVNQAAKWHYMFGGKMRVPLVVRLIIGRGWGQGPQHSQSLQAWFAHVPGLKVVMPTTPHDAKGLFVASVEDDNPVVFIEHRWLHNVTGAVPPGPYRVPLGQARTVRTGTDVTIVATSYMTLEAQRAAEVLDTVGISAEVLDLRTVSPLDERAIGNSVRRTGRLIVADTGWNAFGIGAEIVARVAETNLADLKSPPRRMGLPNCPAPTSPALSEDYYPRAADIVAATLSMLGRTDVGLVMPGDGALPRDVPDPTFTGPF